MKKNILLAGAFWGFFACAESQVKFYEHLSLKDIPAGTKLTLKKDYVVPPNATHVTLGSQMIPFVSAAFPEFKTWTLECHLLLKSSAISKKPRVLKAGRSFKTIEGQLNFPRIILDDKSISTVFCTAWYHFSNAAKSKNQDAFSDIYHDLKIGQFRTLLKDSMDFEFYAVPDEFESL